MYRLLSPHRTWRGFSLIEILLVLTLIGIAAAISLPKVSRITSQNRIQRAAQALQLEVQQAYAISGRNRAPVKIAWNSSTLQVQTTNLAGSTVFRRLSL